MTQLLSDLNADFKVNSRLLDRITVTVFRVNQSAHRGRFRLIKRVGAKVLDAIWMQGVVGAEMDGRAKVGPGLRIPHGGRMIGLDPRAVIGSNVTLMPNSGVARGGPSRGVPVVGDNVTIGRNGGAVGPVFIGDGATIAINSITYRSVAPGDTVIGNPARPIREAVKLHTRARNSPPLEDADQSTAESLDAPTPS